MERVESLKLRFATEPLAAKLGMRLEALMAGYSLVSYTATADDCVTNDAGVGIVQGGVLIGILADFAAVYAAMSAIPAGHTPLMSGGFSFQRPTLAGERVSAEAHVFNTSSRVVSVRVSIYGRDAKLKCEGTYHFARPEARRPILADVYV